jgi:RNA polymerase sigma factor (sigma-70 family)
MRAGTPTTNPVGAALRRLSRLAGAAAADAIADPLLLERYARAGDTVAFTTLVKRHGPMVLGVCRRVLHHEHDAEDAFQATFLILARKASSIRNRDSLSCWLHGVAYRLAARARAQAAGRRRREARGADPADSDLTAELTWRELRAALDEELARLSDDCRGPLVLCYLEGKTQDEAALALAMTKAQLRRRLDRGLALLRGRLVRRGLALSAGLFAVALSQGAAAPPAIAAGLAAATASAAGLFGAGRAVAGAASARAVALAEGGLRAMFVTKLKAAAALLLFFGLVAAGAGTLSHRALAARPAEAPAEEPALAPPVPVAVQQRPAPAREAAAPERPADANALPTGSVLRLGSNRLWRGTGYYFLTFSPDSKVLACARQDGTTRLIEVATGKEIASLDKVPAAERLKAARGSIGWVSGVAFSPDGQLVAVHRPVEGVTVYRRDKGEQVCRFKTDLQFETSGLAFSPDGKTIVVGGVNTPPRLWDAATGKVLRPFEGHEGRAAAVAFAPDGKTVASAGDDATIRVWDPATGKELKRLEGHRSPIQSVAFSPDGKAIASASTDSTVRVWDAAKGEELKRFETTTSAQVANGGIIFVSFSGDGKTVCLGRNDRTIQFWDRESGRELSRWEGPAGSSGNLALAPDGKTVAIGQPQGKIGLWDRATGQELLPDEGHQQGVLAVAYSPDGKALATASADRTVRIWDAATGKELKRLKGHTGAVSALAFSADGKTLASGSRDANDRLVSLWDTATGKEVRHVRLSRGGQPRPGGGFYVQPFAVQSLALSPDGKRLVTLGTDLFIDIWDAQTGQMVRHLTTQSYGFAFAPDGKLACAAPDGSLQLVDPETGKAKPMGLKTDAVGNPRAGFGPGGKEVAKPAARAGFGFRLIVGITYSPDGKSVLLTGYDGGLSLWSLGTGKLLRQITVFDPSQAQQMTMLAANDPSWVGFPYSRARAVFSPDGRTVASYGWDGVVRLNEVATGLERAHFQGHEAAVNSLAFAPDGRTLATASNDTTVLLWDVARPTKEAPKAELTAAEVEGLWADLAGKDGPKAYRAVLGLAAAPKEMVPFFKKELKSGPTPDTKRIPGLLKDLDSEEFAVRQKAAEELQALGELALPALKKLLADKPPLDVVRRVESIIEGIEMVALTPEEARELRAIEALERAATPEARQLLESLAGGAPEVRLTQEAKAAMERLTKRTATAKR